MSSSKKVGVLFQDVFQVREKDPDGKRFDKVSRIKAHSDMYEMDLTLDVNSDLYPVEEGDKFRLAISTTLSLDGTPGADHWDKNLATGSGPTTFLDSFSYVMHGRVFKVQEHRGGGGGGGQLRLDVFVSYGGLLMQVTGSAKELEEMAPDINVFLLMRPVD